MPNEGDGDKRERNRAPLTCKQNERLGARRPGSSEAEGYALEASAHRRTLGIMTRPPARGVISTKVRRGTQLYQSANAFDGIGDKRELTFPKTFDVLLSGQGWID